MGTIEDVDLIVIGSGQGGVPLARDFAKAGKHVVLFERSLVGGTCVNNGCTPSKAFLAAAHSAGRARRAEPLGIFADIRVDQRAALERVRKVRDEWHDGSERRLAELKVDLVRASAAFTGERTVAGGGREVRAPLVVIDAGARPIVPPVPGLAGTPYLTNENWFEQTTLPQRLIVIGGGYIGLELGQGAQRLGSSVTILNAAERVMASEEPDASDVIAASLERDGVNLVANARVVSVAHDGSIFSVALGDGRTFEAEGLLVATGRAPNTADLAAERGGVELETNGTVRVDDFLQTTCPGTYAIGDVAGQPAFTHVAWEDYRRLSSGFAGKPRKRDDRVLSYSTFTEPQLARTGLTADQARTRGFDVRVETLQLEDVARGEEWNLPEGFFRLVADRATGKILGATFVGYEAGEIIHAIGFGIQLGATWRDLDDFVGIHPTFGEGLPSLARLFESESASTQRVLDKNADWEKRLAAVWATLDDRDEETFVAAIDELVRELPSESAIGRFERACAFDSTGHSDLAVPLYKAALDAGLTGTRRRRAVIQMSSSLRNIGRTDEAIALLSAELEADPDELTGAVRAVLALSLVNAGREREAVSVAVTALSEYLPRYNRSMANYARELVEKNDEPSGPATGAS